VSERQRVTFRFGDAIEVHYVAGLPKAGDFVTHRNELWVMVRLERDSLGTVVVCERDRSASPEVEPAAETRLVPPQASTL
jgi:hypothetical protein